MKFHEHKIKFGKEKSFACTKCGRNIDLTKLVIGSGKIGFDRYVNLDIVKFPKVDVVHNLDNYPWPFPDNTFSEIYASHIIEHLDVERAMKEIHRVCKNGALVKIMVPHHSNPFKRMSHRYEGFNLETFTSHFYKGSIYCDTNFKQLKAKFMIRVSRKFMSAEKCKFFNWIINCKNFQKIYERFFCYILPSAEIQYLLKVVK